MQTNILIISNKTVRNLFNKNKLIFTFAPIKNALNDAVLISKLEGSLLVIFDRNRINSEPFLPQLKNYL